MGKIEMDIASPHADPIKIVTFVSTLHSDTVDAPRNLSSTLRARLGEIARNHAGQVPLHGRLFAQWLHHAYPRECPFPHISGSVKPMYPEEWADAQNGGSPEVSQEVMEDYVL